MNHARLAVFLFVPFFAAGCAVDPTGPSGAATGEEVESAASAYSFQPQESFLPYRGGTDGTPDWSQNCGAGGVITGFETRTRGGSAPYSFLYGIGVTCANLRSDGSLAPSAPLGPPIYGDLDKTILNLAVCPYGSIAVGMYSRSATYVDGMGLICSPVDDAAHNQKFFLQYEGGEFGGQPHTDMCPYGYALTYLAVKHESWVIDGIEGHCQRIAP
jgi:hypothetical protein